MNTTPVVDPSSLAVRVRVSSAEEATESQLRRLPSGQDGVRGTRLFQRMCLLVLLIVVSAASFSAFYQKWHFREQGARGTDLIAEFDRMIDGTAHRPYIYRQMFPDIANALTRVLPVDAISRRVPQRAKDRISVAFNLTSKAYPAQYLIFYIATYLFALFAAVGLYKVCTAASFAEPVGGVCGGCVHAAVSAVRGEGWILLRLSRIVLYGSGCLDGAETRLVVDHPGRGSWNVE